MTMTAPRAWLARNPAAIIAAASAAAAANAFIVNILTARALGPELRGHVALVLQACYFVAPLLTLGADRGTVKSQGSQAPPKLSTMIILTLSVAIILAIAAPEYVWLAAPIGLANAFVSLSRADVLTGSPLGNFVIPALGYQAFILVASFALYLGGITWWPAWALAYVLPLPFLAPKLLRRRGPKEPWPWKDNLLLLMGRISQLIVIRSQRLWLPAISGPASLGLFAVVATATEPLFWVAQSLADSRTGRGAQKPLGGFFQQTKHLAPDAAFFLPLAAAGGVAIYCLVEPVFGSDFSAAKELVIPLTVAGALLSLYRQVTGWILSAATERTYMITEVMAAGIALGVYPVAIWIGGGLGAAWGTVGVYAVCMLLAMTVYRNVTHTEGDSSCA